MAKEKPAEPTTPANLGVRFLKPEGGIPLFYANHIQMGHTVFDLRIVFGEVTDVSEGQVEITHRAQVTMSWLEAKALAEALAIYVKHYESNYGPIKTEFSAVTNPGMPEIPRIIMPKK